MGRRLSGMMGQSRGTRVFAGVLAACMVGGVGLMALAANLPEAPAAAPAVAPAKPRPKPSASAAALRWGTPDGKSCTSGAYAGAR